jgi:hypothetical protein
VQALGNRLFKGLAMEQWNEGMDVKEIYWNKAS